jgi:hypothetical protein
MAGFFGIHKKEEGSLFFPAGYDRGENNNNSDRS